MERKCNKCGHMHPVEFFDGNRTTCKYCKQAAVKAWKAANPDKARANDTAARNKRRADPAKKAAEAERENARRRAANPRVGRLFIETCNRCMEEFEYRFIQKHRYICDLCRKHDSDWTNFRLTGKQAEQIRNIKACPMCGTDKPGGRFNEWHIDHDHVTGKIRGALCAACNTSIGLMRDDPELIRRLADYVESHRTDLDGHV